MSKKFFRNLAICVSVFAFSLLIGYLAYYFTLHYVAQNTVDHTIPINDNVAAEEVMSPTEPVTEEQIEKFDHYLARLEGDVIKIYICGEFGEEFLYGLDVYVQDLPQQDVEKLKQGVELKTKQDLTSFEEDYNS